MNGILEGNQLRGGLVRWLVWGGAAALLLLPLVAMQYTQEVQWTWHDFVFMGVMLLVVCIAYEVAARIARSNAYMVAAGLAVSGGFFTVWANLAVGIVGDEDNPVNSVFLGVILFEIVAALLARFRAGPMAWAMVATAVAQLVACLYVWLAGQGYVFVFTALMCGLWLASAQLFRNAAALQAATAVR